MIDIFSTQNLRLALHDGMFLIASGSLPLCPDLDKVRAHFSQPVTQKRWSIYAKLGQICLPGFGEVKMKSPIAHMLF